MRVLCTVTWYKLKIMFSDRMFFLAMTILPILIMLATGYALRYEKLNNIPVAVVDEDKSEYSQLLIKRFLEREGFKIYITDRAQAVELLKGNSTEVIYIIKEKFQERIKGGEMSELVEYYKSPASISTGFINEVLAGMIMRFVSEDYATIKIKEGFLKANKRFDDDYNSLEIKKYMDSLWEPKPLLDVIYKEKRGEVVKQIKTNSLPAATATSSGIIVAFTMFYILFNSGWIIEERVNGTLKRLVSIHGGLGTAFASNIIALFICGIAQIIFFNAVIRIAFDIVLFTSVWAYVIFGVYVLSVIALSLLLSAIIKTTSKLQAVAPFLALITSFMGGCLWNFVEVPKNMILLSKLTLQGWALSGINNILLSGGITSIKSIFVLLAISLIMIPISYFLISRHVRVS